MTEKKHKTDNPMCRRSRAAGVLGIGRAAVFRRRLPHRFAAGVFLAAVLVPVAASCGELHVYLNNEDHVSATELTLEGNSLSMLTPHCGRVVVDRSAVKGIAGDTEHASDILQFTGGTDIVNNRNGDRLSGQILGIKDGNISLQASFASGKIVTVGMDQLDYLVFASQKKAEPFAELNQVRVIFTNGDVVSGKIVGMESGKFVLDPPYCENVRFDGSALRSLHNARESREFFAGGIAQALMDMLEKSGEAAGIYGQVYPSLIKSFLKDGDKKGALLVFRRICSYVNDQYAFQRIGDEFLSNNMPEAAIQAYEKMLEKSPTYYYAYTKLFEAYVKMGRYPEAAQTYELLLSNPMVGLDGYGTSINKIRMDLSEVYIKLKEIAKAAEQLGRVIIAPPEQEDLRQNALSKLISLFKQQGKIEALVGRYKTELTEKNRILGESYLEMVKFYLNEGKVMKARTYVQRLEELGLTEYAEKAKQLIKD